MLFLPILLIVVVCAAALLIELACVRIDRGRAQRDADDGF
jgi:hypothetical protein